ncbi:MAG: hypothetical protein LBB89_03665 [Treponema sp.]|jgi:hypothetical protein|nr:hypothetical protein [Treponema sp.]
MKNSAWNQFTKARNHYRSEIKKLLLKLPELQNVQQKLVNSRSPSYTVETPIVYNSALDDVKADSEIRLILVADNPGRREQMAENRRYLVGPSGKIAEKFFRDNPSLNTDFRTNVIILNKTPIHTPRTVELKELCRLGGSILETALAESQRIMARLLLEFHQALICENGKVPPVWIIGYSEMKKGGVFEAYTNELKAIYGSTDLKESVFLYRHFSMNQFTIDLKQQTVRGETLDKTLKWIGTAYRERFLWR